MRNFILIAILGAVFATGLSAEPPQGDGFVMTRSTIDAGGGTSAGGDYVLTGTIGQPDANAQPSSDWGYDLAGGFWARIIEFLTDVIFQDGFE